MCCWARIYSLPPSRQLWRVCVRFFHTLINLPPGCCQPTCVSCWLAMYGQKSALFLILASRLQMGSSQQYCSNRCAVPIWPRPLMNSIPVWQSFSTQWFDLFGGLQPFDRPWWRGCWVVAPPWVLHSKVWGIRGAMCYGVIPVWHGLWLVGNHTLMRPVTPAGADSGVAGSCQHPHNWEC